MRTITYILQNIRFIEQLNDYDYSIARGITWPISKEEKMGELYDELRFACEAQELAQVIPIRKAA